MFKLVVGNTVSFPVKGSITGPEGQEMPFDFTIKARRDTSGVLDAALAERDRKTDAFMTERITGWTGVLGEGGEPVPFSPDALAQLFAFPGLANLCFTEYLQAVAARGKQKN
jgi:hypothetical protein